MEMPTPRQCSTFGVTPAFLAALAVAGAFVGFVAYDQSHWWWLKPDYAFGWLVPLLVAFLVFERWRHVRAEFGARLPSPLRPWQDRILRLFAASVLAGGLLIFLLGAIYRGGEGSTQPGSFALAAGFSGILLGMIVLNVPAGLSPSVTPAGFLGRLRADRRVRVAALFVFPAIIWMISAPLVTAVENAISLFLLRRVVAVAAGIFGILGYPLVQQGNVLILPRGQVGVAEACSGIRSLTGCLFAGSFLAAMFLDRFWKKIVLVGCAMVLAFLTNLLRSLFLTAWAYAFGSQAIEGRLHDMTGYAVLGLTCICLFLLMPLFSASNWRRWLGIDIP